MRHGGADSNRLRGRSTPGLLSAPQIYRIGCTTELARGNMPSEGTQTTPSSRLETGGGHSEASPAFQFSALHNIPPALARALLSSLKEVPALLQPDFLEHVRVKISSGEIVDYCRAWAAFAYLYFGANFAKAYLAALHLLRVPAAHSLELVDLGCGAGAATSGIVACLRNYSRDLKLSRVTAIDVSTEQLRLFNSTTGAWLRNCWPDLTIDLIKTDLMDYLKSSDQIGKSNKIFLASYVIPELSEADRRQFRTLIRMVQPLDALIIDTDPELRGLRVERPDGSSILVPYSSLEIDLSFLRELEIASVQPHLAAGHSFDHADERQLLKRYFAAWRSHDLEEVRRIFHPDATYEILGVKTLHGRSEIEDYWRQNKACQDSVVLEFYESSYTHGQVTVNWDARFRRLDKHATYRLSGIMRLAVSKGTILYLTEAYNKNVTPD
jgi:SnoaL-like domain